MFKILIKTTWDVFQPQYKEEEIFIPSKMIPNLPLRELRIIKNEKNTWPENEYYSAYI